MNWLAPWSEVANHLFEVESKRLWLEQRKIADDEAAALREDLATFHLACGECPNCQDFFDRRWPHLRAGPGSAAIIDRTRRN